MASCHYDAKNFKNHTFCLSARGKTHRKIHTNQTTIKYSSKGKYISLTVRIIATSRQQLDAINHDLQSCPLVSYLL